jgi:tetratricopeptide (TPR) repeat protein
MAGVRPIVGRTTELAELVGGLDEARQGRGGVWFVTGEPGIGKTRLVEEVAERAIGAGASVHWGRCWEAGGAPAYWPWIEVLRALSRAPPSSHATRAVTERAGVLSQLLPELAGVGDARAEPLGGERGRFELFDALACALCDAAREQPLVLVIEDLHVADDATLSVLELLNQQARSSRLCVIGTLRDADARLARGGGALERLARGPRRIELGRLDKPAVGEFLAKAAGAPPSAAACDAVHRVTEGNPLFLVEVSRLLDEQRGWQSAENLGLTVPRSVRHAIRARLGRLSARARDALEVASVLGRQFRAVTLAGLAERPLAELAAPLTEALDEGILSEIAPAEFRFSHVLLREVLHQDLDEARRAALHWEAADALRRRTGHDAAWSEIAHHSLEAGPAAREAAVEACTRAAQESLATLAFSDAAEWYTRALAALGQDPSSDVEQRGPLLLSLAEAQFHSGDLAAGQATCRRALGLARALGDGELFARAALVCGTVLQYAVVDVALVGLLREALAALPEGPGATRAIVMARLAAAEQPAPEPETFFRVAREAIAMARSVGDSSVLLDTLRYAISALMDLAPPGERLELNREYVRLAQARHQPIEALRGSMRLVFDQLELGDLAAMDASIQSVEELGRRLGHPFYTWRAVAFRAMQAIFVGRVSAAEGHIELAERLGQAGRDPTVATAVAFQRRALARALGRDEEVLASMARIAPLFAGSELGTLSVRVMTAEALVRVGRVEQAAAHVGRDDLTRLIGYGDVSVFAPLANVALALRLPEVANAALAVLDASPRAFASGGMTTMTAGEPVLHIRATLQRAAKRFDDAERCYALALEQAEQAGAAAFAAAVALDHALLLAERDPALRSAEIQALCRRALAGAESLGADGLARRARALSAECSQSRGAPSAEPRTPHRVDGVAIERDGESWLVRSGTIQLRLADSKGLKWLAQLVREPGREFHVLDLCAGAGTLDAGDAGELLDPQAREEYRERVQSLEAELSQAREHNDAGRAGALAEELEFLQLELSRALGLGGRERRASSAAERARINVQRRLRDALRRITLQHAELGQRLERSLKTGLYCSYRP